MVQNEGTGIAAAAKPYGRPGGLTVSCSFRAIEVRIITGQGPVPAVPVMMTLDEGIFSEAILKPFDFDRYYGADEHLAFTVATKMSFAQHSVTFDIDGVRYEFSMDGFPRIWGEMKRRCSL